MSWLSSILAYIEGHPYLDKWPDAQAVLSKYNFQKGAEALAALPLLTCLAAGGNPELAVPLAASFTLLTVASELLDDFQDQEPGQLGATWPLNRVLASSLSLIFLAQSCLARLKTDEATMSDIIDNYAQVGVIASVGQSLALPGRILSLDEYWAHAQAKSGLIFAVGAWSGVRLATRDESKLIAAQDFGLALGALSQAEDDCRDFYTAASVLHPTEYFASLPVIMALEKRNHPRYQELANLLSQQAGYDDAVWSRRIHDSVIEMDGLTMAVGVAKVYEQKALTALSAIGPCDELSNYVQDHLRYFE